MSLGYRGKCTLVQTRGNTALYTYKGENWNLSAEVRSEAESIEGEFWVMVADGDLDLKDFSLCGTDANTATDLWPPAKHRILINLFHSVRCRYVEDGTFPAQEQFVQ